MNIVISVHAERLEEYNNKKLALEEVKKAVKIVDAAFSAESRLTPEEYDRYVCIITFAVEIWDTEVIMQNRAITAMGLLLGPWAKALAAGTGGYMEILWGGPVPSLGGNIHTYQ